MNDDSGYTELLDELRAEIAALKGDIVSLEYQSAEGERFLPEYTRQIEEPLRDEIAAIKAEIERLYAHGKHCQDLALEHYGLLLCIRSWLTGELPEANAQQFIEQINAAKQPKVTLCNALGQGVE